MPSIRSPSATANGSNTWPAARARSRSAAACTSERLRLGDPVGAEGFGDVAEVRRQPVWYVLVGARKISGSCSNTSRRPYWYTMAHEAHVVAALELALLEQRARRALDRRTEVGGMQLGDERAPRSLSQGRRYSKTAWRRRSLVPKWYCTAELLPFPAAAPIWRRETPSMPRSAKSRSATRTICSLVDGAITDMGGSQHSGQRESTVLD